MWDEAPESAIYVSLSKPSHLEDISMHQLYLAIIAVSWFLSMSLLFLSLSRWLLYSLAGWQVGKGILVFTSRFFAVVLFPMSCPVNCFLHKCVFFSLFFSNLKQSVPLWANNRAHTTYPFEWCCHYCNDLIWLFLDSSKLCSDLIL